MRAPPTKQVIATWPSGARSGNSDELKSAPRMLRFSLDGTSMPNPSSTCATSARSKPRVRALIGGYSTRSTSAACLRSPAGNSMAASTCAGVAMTTASTVRALDESSGPASTTHCPSLRCSKLTGQRNRSVPTSEAFSASVSVCIPSTNEISRARPGAAVGVGFGSNTVESLDACSGAVGMRPRVAMSPADSDPYFRSRSTTRGNACIMLSFSVSPAKIPEMNGSTA